MITYWPSYYRDFKCKAGECHHTCCAGWVIGIDECSLKRFEKDPDVKSKISDGCFVLREDGRCPFLRDDDLCELIVKNGEEYLCDICREHPRFYNDCEDHIEAGVGMVCEMAAELILGAEYGFELLGEDGSKITLPSDVTAILDKSIPLTETLARLSGGRRANTKLRAEIFAEMEVMDPKWLELLMGVIGDPAKPEEEDAEINGSIKYRNFAAYLLYRYNGAGRFAAEATYLLSDLVMNGYKIEDAARMFSGEVEYSDINIDEALETFE